MQGECAKRRPREIIDPEERASAQTSEHQWLRLREALLLSNFALLRHTL
jgi:hypothetical protein